jgi:hypothetical protein
VYEAKWNELLSPFSDTVEVLYLQLPVPLLFDITSPEDFASNAPAAVGAFILHENRSGYETRSAEERVIEELNRWKRFDNDVLPKMIDNSWDRDLARDTASLVVQALENIFRQVVLAGEMLE